MRSLLLAGLATLALAPAVSSAAPWDDEAFRDPVDGRLDTSRWLLDRKGFLPVPIVITEPAVGYGGGLALLFFHRNADSAPATREMGAARAFEPPDITAGAAFGTENGSKGGAVGHLGFSEGRRWRYVGGIARGSINLAWYGTPGIGPGTTSEGRDVNLDGTLAIADVRRRFGDSEWWAGLRYQGSSVKSKFARDGSPEPPRADLDAAISGLGPVVEYDGRDNIFTPNAGFRAYLEAIKFSPSLGSDYDFTRSRLALQGFHPVGDSLVVGLRADLQGVDGDAPFYARPFVELRGIPAMRYQGDRVAVAEIEGRWNLDGRWSLVGFAGAGRAAGSNAALRDEPTRTTVGAGFRYLLTRALGMRVGIDVARGPEDKAVYLVMGSAWR